MLVKLSSKGQLVIPKPIRKALGLGTGDQFHVQIKDEKIILERVSVSALIDKLHGKYANTGLLDELEKEHQHEMEQDERNLHS